MAKAVPHGSRTNCILCYTLIQQCEDRLGCGSDFIYLFKSFRQGPSADSTAVANTPIVGSKRVIQMAGAI